MIELRGASRTYVTDHRAVVTETDALVDVDLTVPPRQFVSIVGSSGSGKTTLLRIVAGLDQLTSGEVRVDGRPVTGPGPDRAVVFQDAALYPWRTVRANVRLGLELSGLARGEEAERIVDRQLALVGLEQFANQYPAQLSGGMRQRVGLARALAVAPDAPDGRAVRSAGRDQPRADGRRAAPGVGRDRRTVLFVTHSLDEALHLSDRVVVLRGGRVVADTPVDIGRPRDPDASAFLELRQFLRGAL